MAPYDAAPPACRTQCARILSCTHDPAPRWAWSLFVHAVRRRPCPDFAYGNDACLWCLVMRRPRGHRRAGGAHDVCTRRRTRVRTAAVLVVTIAAPVVGYSTTAAPASADSVR